MFSRLSSVRSVLLDDGAGTILSRSDVVVVVILWWTTF